MSLVVEDGTGLSTAESYISVTNADTRHTNRGNDTWAALTTGQKEEALRRATDYMEQAYRDRWRGYRQVTTQALSWPRNSVVVDEFVYIHTDIVPADVANACADLALKAAADDLNADLTRGVVREKVGPIETEYDRFSPQSTRFPAIDMMLAPYLTGGGANARLVRA
jgi:hypothetical protein